MENESSENSIVLPVKLKLEVVVHTQRTKWKRNGGKR